MWPKGSHIYSFCLISRLDWSISAGNVMENNYKTTITGNHDRQSCMRFHLAVRTLPTGCALEGQIKVRYFSMIFNWKRGRDKLYLLNVDMSLKQQFQ